MPSYPPPIAEADFADVNPPNSNVVASCGQHMSALLGLDLVPANFAGVLGTSFLWDSTVNPTHAQLAADAAGRRAFAPGADNLEVIWRFVNPANITRGTIEVFSRFNAIVWRKVLVWPDGHPDAAGTTPFSGSLAADADTVCSTTDQVTFARAYRQADYPSNVLNVDGAPYKLKMTIASSRDNVRVHPAVRWIYIDVYISAIRLTLGAQRIIPREASVIATGHHTRNIAVHTAITNALTQAPNLERQSTASVTVPVEANVFGVNTGEWSDDSQYNAFRALRTPPSIPIVATPRLRSYGGNDVDAPAAVAGARFLWDWRGGMNLTNDFHALDRTELSTAFARSLNESPAGARNAHSSVGGKRGATPRLFRTGVNPAQYVDGGAGRFPFALEACANRIGAAFSVARGDSDHAGKTGVVFVPSNISRDEFTLDVYYAYGPRNGWDVVSTPAELEGAPPFDVAHAKTSTFKMTRVVRIARHWTSYQNGTFDANTFDWNALADIYFRPAGITLDVSGVVNNATPIPLVQFRQLFSQEVQTLSEPRRLCFAGAHLQLSTVAAFQCETFDHYRSALSTLFTARLRTMVRLGGAQPANVNAGSPEAAQLAVELYLGLAYGYAGGDADVNRVADDIRGGVYPSQDAFNTGAAGHVQMLLGVLGMGGVMAAQVANTIFTYAGDDYFTGALAAAKVTKANFVDWMKPWQGQFLVRLCSLLSSDPNLGAGDGFQIFQFDFMNNYGSFPNSGEAITTTSNRATCPECGIACDAAARAANRCPRPICRATLRNHAAVISYIPWTNLQAFSSWKLYSLQRNRDKYFFMSNMEGVRPEILLAHEIGHHLFIPHAPHCFTMPDPVPGTWIWRAYRLMRRLKPSMETDLQNQTTGGGNKPAYHATNHQACIMGYNFAAMPDLHFCWKCALRLRGWSGAVVETL